MIDRRELAGRIGGLEPVARLRRALSRSGVDEAWLVGGLVRDMAQGCTPDPDMQLDLDAALPVSDWATAHAVAHAFGLTPFLLDKEHGAWRVSDGRTLSLDLVAYRAPTLDGDLAARDYTVNAVALDLLGERGIYDPLDGLGDLAVGVLRLCSELSLTQDPLRVLRAYRFMATHGFKVAPDLPVQLAAQAGRLGEVSPERVRDEWFKLLDGDRAGWTLRTMLAHGVLETLFPLTGDWVGFDQGIHHEHPLMEHSLRCVEGVERIVAGLAAGNPLHLTQPERLAVHLRQLHEQSVSRLALLKFAALMHDAGKPETLRMEGDRHRFFGHEARSAELVGELGVALRMGKKATRAARALVAGHMRMINLASQEKPTRRSRLKYLRDLEDCAPEAVLLTLADEQATGHRPELFSVLQETGRELLALHWESLDHEPLEPLLRGRDLVELLGMEQGDDVGRVLRAVEEAERAGRVASREESLVLAERLVRELARCKN